MATAAGSLSIGGTMSINVTDAPDSHYRIMRIMDGSAKEAAKHAIGEGFEMETFLHLAETAARSAYLAERARMARRNARNGKQ